MIEIMHRGTNHVAFRSIIDAKIGDAVVAGNIMLLDGTKPKDGDPIICGTCGHHLANREMVPAGC